MTCEEARDQMLDQVGNAPEGPLATHLSGCGSCRTDWAELRAGFNALPELPPRTVPTGLRDSLRRSVLAKLAAPRRSWAGMWPGDGVVSVASGSAAAFVSLLLLHARGLLQGIAPVSLAGGAIAWAGLFTLAFWTLLRRWDSDPQLGHLVLGSLSAAGFFLVGNHLLPLPNVVQWCSSHLGARLGPLFFGLGALYAALPLVLFSLRASGRSRPGPRRALLAGGFFFFLVAPAIFLQCAFFTLGALAAWLLGAVAGSLAGSAASYLLAGSSRPSG